MYKQFEKQKEKLMAIRKEITVECVAHKNGTGSCENIDNGFCTKYPVPATFWRMGGCPMATHVNFDKDLEGSEKKRVGQQKQKKKR